MNPLEAVVVVDLRRRSPTSDLPASFERIHGRAPVQRHLHHLAEEGVSHCAVLLSGSGAELAESQLGRLLGELSLGATKVSVMRGEMRNGSREPAYRKPIVVIDGEAVYDRRLYRAALASQSCVTIVDGDSPVGLRSEERFEADSSDRVQALVAVDDLPQYLPNMRRRLRPYWVRLTSPADYRRAADLIMDSAQKGILDFPARFLHPLPENFLARALARTGVTPNQVTLFTGLLGFWATYLFVTQSFGWALAIAAAVNVLDGVDGKLARIKLLSSKIGDRIDHVLDVSFEFSWYLGLGWGLAQTTGHGLPFALGATMIAIQVVARGMSGVYTLLTRKTVHDHTAFDRAFRLVAGRRNIYVMMWLVGWASQALLMAFYAVVGWAVITLSVYVTRVLTALVGRWRSRALSAATLQSTG